jgi:hypothetical protein
MGYVEKLRRLVGSQQTLVACRPNRWFYHIARPRSTASASVTRASLSWIRSDRMSRTGHTPGYAPDARSRSFCSDDERIKACCTRSSMWSSSKGLGSSSAPSPW